MDDHRPVTPRMTNRRDALADILNNVNSTDFNMFHQIDQRLHGNSHDEDKQTTTKDATTTTTKRAGNSTIDVQRLDDRSVLRSPRFHSRRNALPDTTKLNQDDLQDPDLSVSERRALCSRFQQLQLLEQHHQNNTNNMNTDSSSIAISVSNNNKTATTLCN